MENLNAGTKEVVTVDVSDRLGSITTIPSADFKILNDDGTIRLDWTGSTTIVGMECNFLIDTTGWPVQHYRMLVRLNLGSQAPILGPYHFDLI